MLNYITLDVSNKEIAEEVQSITLKAFDQLRCLVTTVLLFFVSMAIYRFITGQTPLISLIVIVLLSFATLIWLYFRIYMRVTTDQLVLIAFALLSIVCVVTFTGHLPGALKTRKIGSLSNIYDFYFKITVLFRLVKFKYGLSVMLVPCVLVKVF